MPPLSRFGPSRARWAVASRRSAAVEPATSSTRRSSSTPHSAPCPVEQHRVLGSYGQARRDVDAQAARDDLRQRLDAAAVRAVLLGDVGEPSPARSKVSLSARAWDKMRKQRL